MTATRLSPPEMAAITLANWPNGQAWSAEQIAKLQSQDNVLTAYAHQGFALIRLAGPEAELLAIEVAPEAQHQGSGRYLLQTALKLAKARGAEEMHLEVAEGNAIALRLYTQEGFQHVGVRKGYYRRSGDHREDAILMCKTLGP